MKSAKSFLKELDTVRFDSASLAIAKQLKNPSLTAKELVEQVDIPEYKKQALVEYLDKNKDKLLSLVSYKEGEPVLVGDEYAPAARKHGKVVSKGEAEGTVKVRFEDGEYDVPEHHVSRLDAISEGADAVWQDVLMALSAGHPDVDPTDSLQPVMRKHKVSFDDIDNMAKQHGHKDLYSIFDEHLTEKTQELGASHKQQKLIESKYFALMESGELLKVIFENVGDLYEMLEQQTGERALAIFPYNCEHLAESALAEEMTPEQKAKREEIIMALKRNKSELMKKYGDRWEGVMYAIATKQAMGESLLEAADIVFSEKLHNGDTVTISDSGPYYAVKVTKPTGEVVDVKEFNSIKDAEKAVQEYL